jgi:hypothetical protein
MEMVLTTAQGGIPTTPKSKKPVYTVYKNKHGVEFKVINFDNEDLVPNKGIVEFEVLKKQDFQRLRDTKFACPVVKDGATGIYYALFAGFQENGDPKWIDIPLGVINIYDRSIPSDAKKAFILANSCLTQGSPNAKLGRLVKFRLVDKEKAASDKIKKISDGKRALSIAESLYGEGLINMARDLGINTSSSVTMLTAEVMEYAMENPVEFLNIAEHPNRDVITILNKAIDTRVVENDMTKGLTYNGAPLGHNFDWAVKFLLENPTVAMAINMKATEKQAETVKSMQVNMAEVKDSSTPENAEMEALKKQLAEMKAKNEELLQNKALDVPTNPLEKELEELKAEAKVIGGNVVKGLHTFKATPESISKLRAKIAEAKK